MADTEQPQLYLITPPELELSRFPDVLARVLDAQEIACVRLALASQDEDVICRAADACREVTHARDVALVVERHLMLVERLGLDGVHLTDGARTVRHARKELGEDAIIGAYCGTSRHEGMNAGESGADYISFGPIGQTALGTGDVVDPEILTWWSEVIELPAVAEGALDAGLIAALAPAADFFGIGEEIWSHDDPVQALADLTAALR
ncbi:thiamine phosphate synthase [Litorivita pollutaquae]|uniref:Thiamine phosphate synthase n=1 Tax=Litorivita pollutaquae TaxID=2200892 RepID=A0A2V4MNH0_9RHOB|nr:thiamine phosphate synthase [Litorivita pollutaquae]OUS21806.1 thiamine phosphate synthase [Rhodobacterales bacterium 59_46_T64]PYC48275.1 thiamine phosphate synthase [Litorivita pollutaquae]